MKRIGILGIGGIGGYFGGLLAKQYHQDPEVDVIFIARGKTKENINQQGLILTSLGDTLTIHPALCGDNTDEIGKLDVLIVCVKSYSMISSLSRYMQCLKEDSIIITLQNAVDQTEVVEGIVPSSITHLPGCVYIISNIASPGNVVRKKGPEKFYFGPVDSNLAPYQWIQDLLTRAKIESYLVDNINDTIWNKYLFISPVATTTSYFNYTIGKMIAEPESRSFLVALVSEGLQIANAKGIKVKPDFAKKVLEIAGTVNYESKSSMQIDVENGNQAEIDGLTAYLVAEGKKLNIPTPTYDKALNKLRHHSLTVN